MNRTICWLVAAVAVCGLAAAVKLSELPSASSVSLSDLVPIVASGQTRKATVGQLADAVANQENDYAGTFTGDVTGGSLSGDSLTVSDGVTPPFYGDALASLGANLGFGLRVHSEQSNGLMASSRNGQAGKFAQTDWDAETSDTPVVRVARGSGTSGVNHSPLLTLETASPEWSDGDALLVKREGVEVFRLTAEGFVQSEGLVLPQTADLPTNAVPAGSGSVTNWLLVNLGGVPTFVATNHAAGGWLQKALWP